MASKTEKKKERTDPGKGEKSYIGLNITIQPAKKFRTGSWAGLAKIGRNWTNNKLKTRIYGGCGFRRKNDRISSAKNRDLIKRGSKRNQGPGREKVKKKVGANAQELTSEGD